MIGFEDLDVNPMTSGKAAVATSDAAKQERASIVNGGETGYEQITCRKCGGHGSRTYGYVNIRTYPCGICRGTGKVTARRLANVERFKKAEATKEQNKRVARMSFQEANSELIAGIAAAAEWSTFAASLMDSFRQYGKLSERQIAAGQSMLDKIAANKKARAEANNAKGGDVNVSAIEALFNNARASGLKRLGFRTMEIDISAAKETGRNPGALYVKRNGEYVGKIVTGKFMATSAAPADTLAKVLEVAADPLGMAKLYGKQTGNCSCCGRELTDPVSVANGIGPICESKWGF